MNYPLYEAKKQIISILKETISKLNYTFEIKLEIPPEEMGDFAFPCFQLAPIVKKSPNNISKEIAQKIKKNRWVEKIEVKGAYINFFIDKKVLQTETIKLILEKKDKYGFLNKKNKKVIVEHTSANPNGPLHVGRARNPIIGDTIVRIFRMAGYNVESQFYLDDMGKQATILAWGYNDEGVTKEIDEFYNNNKFYPGGSKFFTHKSDHQRVGFYQIASNRMQEDEKTLSEINELIKSSENGENKAITLIHDAYNPVLEGIKESLQRINITIDKYVPESDFVKDKSVYEVIKKLQKSEHCKDENGALYIDLETFGITGRNTKFFFLRSDGTTLYATRDIAYHIWKAKQADILVNVLGEDHKLESKQVEIALNLVGAKKNPKVIFYSFVSLPGGKMSTRRGRVVFLDDLIEECVRRARYEVKKRREPELSEEKMEEIAEIIGIGALRYNIIKVQPEKDIMFKWEEALNFEGNASPFIQYAHARTCGILSKSKDPIKDYDATLLIEESEVNLIKTLAKLPIVIDEACEGFKPHIIAAYLFEVASSFNQFYRDCPVLPEENKNLRIARLSLVNATKIVIRNGLDLLGIVAPEEM